jgi:hypothetical protein
MSLRGRGRVREKGKEGGGEGGEGGCIPIEHLHGVQMSDRQDQLGGVEADPRLRQRPKALDELLEVAAAEEAHADVQIVLALKSELESCGEGVGRGVGHRMEDVSLSERLLLVGESVSSETTRGGTERDRDRGRQGQRDRE